ncbi:MAG TPA: hypothetical protein VNW51_07975 [Mucilaginibacter sp.]|nr:hypothetical protein [Mucilaginibacter sp.]
MKIKVSKSFSYLLVLLAFSGCSPLISSYDQYSYTQATSLKVDALNLMGEAVEDYKLHEAESKLVILNIQKLMEYEKHLPKNTITMNQWTLLTDTNGNLLGGFLKEWKAKHMLRPAFIINKQEQVSRGFDEIIKLEASKIHY